MFSTYFIVLLLGHILGDFYFQTKGMAAKKENSIKKILLHGLIYWLTMLLISLPIFSIELTVAMTLAAIVHTLINIILYIYQLKMPLKNRKSQVIEGNLFFIGQLLNGISLVIIGYLLVANGVVIREWQFIDDFFNTLGISEVKIMSWVVAFLIVHQPTNRGIQKLLALYKPNDKEEEFKRDHNAGRFIGTLERMIMLMFLALNQYSAIGLVLTAKSIARYDRISKDKDFAEYYLLGTLLSTAVAIVVSVIV